jgi:hypothetical protein
MSDSLQSSLTSYVELFNEHGQKPPTVTRIEVPLIQRDYAQGRIDPITDEIRERFLDALHDALTGGRAIDLDFVYGEVDGDGVLTPLDGQQRLTTLFLLHWYVAARRADIQPSNAYWRFSYATRHSAQQFCDRLVGAELDGTFPAMSPSTWIKNQPWYLFMWKHDPTVMGMLHMLDEIHERFDGDDFDLVWMALTEHQQVTFHRLVLPNLGNDEDLYIKMNSRGKPLTAYEIFKVHLLRTLDARFPDDPRVAGVAKALDTDWTDLMWPYRDSKRLVDSSLLRYMDFVLDACAWRDAQIWQRRLGQTTSTRFDKCNEIFGAERKSQHLDFLINAFNAWGDASESGADQVAQTFAETFTKPRLFRNSSTNLFKLCVQGEPAFALPQRLLLYAVLLHKIRGETPDFLKRVRIVRNLIEHSNVEGPKMPQMISAVEHLITAGELDFGSLGIFESRQVDDEKSKQVFLAKNDPLTDSLHRLEELDVLRGALGAFPHDAASWESRVDAFGMLFADPALRLHLARALIATGDYHRRLSSRLFLFGSPSPAADEPWRNLLTGARADALEPTGRVLAALLDSFSKQEQTPEDFLQARIAGFLNRAELASPRQFDWRYYLVKYPPESDKTNGRYFSDADAMGYGLCLLRTITPRGFYRDAFIHAVYADKDLAAALPAEPEPRGQGSDRSLKLTSGARVRFVPSGIELVPPTDAGKVAGFRGAVLTLGDERDGRWLVPTTDSAGVDVEDRVEAARTILRTLLDVSL